MKGREKNKISEDLEFSIRVREKTGKRIVYNPKARVQHRVPQERLRWRYIIQWSYWIGASRKALKRSFQESKRQTSVLGTEYRLLHRIITRLLPDTIKGFFTSPFIACRKLLLTTTVLACVSFGYLR